VPNPIISALADAQKSQIDTLQARAQFIDTLRSEQQKAAEKRMAKVQEQALTIKQAREQAAQDAADQQQRAQQSIMAVMPQPQVVRGDRPGIGQALATSSHGSIGGLENILGAISGGPQPAQQTAQSTIPNDLYGLNAANPIESGRMGENYTSGPGGTITQEVRQPIQTGIRGVDLVNSIIGAATGGKFPLAYTQRNEQFSAMRQQLLDKAALAAAALREHQALVKTEGVRTGKVLYGMSQGASGNPSEVFSDLAQRLGPDTAKEAFTEGLRQAQIQDFEVRKAAAIDAVKQRSTSADTEQRQKDLAAYREGLRQGRPTVQSDNRAAKILLGISQGQQPTPEERKFLDERQKLSPLDQLKRDVIQGVTGSIGGGAAPPAPAAPTKTLTPALYQKLQGDFGQPVTQDNYGEFSKFLQSQGY